MGSSSSMGVLHTQGTGPLQGPAARIDGIGEQIGRRGAHNSPNPESTKKSGVPLQRGQGKSCTIPKRRTAGAPRWPVPAMLLTARPPTF